MTAKSIAESDIIARKKDVIETEYEEISGENA